MKRYYTENGTVYTMAQVREVQDKLTNYKGERFTSEEDLNSWVAQKVGETSIMKRSTYEELATDVELRENKRNKELNQILLDYSQDTSKYTKEEIQAICKESVELREKVEKMTLAKIERINNQ